MAHEASHRLAQTRCSACYERKQRAAPTVGPVNAHAYPTTWLQRHLSSQAGPDADGSARAPFDRDRDRLLYSSAFRALGQKTQVVAAGELGFQHNRLTHTLKVAQIGKALGVRLRAQGASVDPVLIETACLAHDIGHPPFGHAGEEALNDEVERRREQEFLEAVAAANKAGEEPPPRPEVWDGFEGNAQNLRVLTRLATHRHWQEPGLHLTRAALLAATKYPWTRTVERKGGTKWGAYDADVEALSWMLQGRPDGAQDLPFEEQIMTWADDVTYAVHDVEDWYRSGRIPLDALFEFKRGAEHPNAGRDENPTLTDFLDKVERRWGARGKAFDREGVVTLLHRLKDRVHVEEPFHGSRIHKGRIHNTVTDLISYFTDPTQITHTGTGLAYDGELTIPPERKLGCAVLKEMVWIYVIGDAGLAAQQHGQQRIVRDLVHWLAEDHERLLPIDRLDEYAASGDLTRTIADHVATLTEPMAVSLHKKLAGTDLGNMTDMQ